MKYKKFKKAVNNDSSLLKLKAKDLADIFEIKTYEAKYFKKRFKDELSYVPMEGFDSTDTFWFNDVLTTKKLPQNSQTMLCDCSFCVAAREESHTLNPNYDKLKELQETFEYEHQEDLKNKLMLYGVKNIEQYTPTGIIKLAEELGINCEMVNKPPRRYKQTTPKTISSASGSIIEVRCICPVCNVDIVLDCFNSGETLVECPNCVVLLSLKDNVVERYEGVLPKSKENTLEYLLNEIKKLSND